MGKRQTTDNTDGQAKKGKWACPKCDKKFDYQKNMKRHMREHGDKVWKCNTCHKEFTRKDLLARHKQIHGHPIHICCGKSFWRTDKYREHIKAHNVTQTDACNSGEIIEDTPEDLPIDIPGDQTEESGGAKNYREHIKSHNITQTGAGNSGEVTDETPMPKQREDEKETEESGDEPTEDCMEALGGTFKVISMSVQGTVKFDPMSLLKLRFDEIKTKLGRALTEGGIKWYLSIQVQFSKPKGEIMERATPHFRGKCQISLKSEDLDESMRESIKKIYSSFIEYQRQGSNWTLDKVLKIQIHLARYKPLKASSYIPLPIKLRTKHSVVNVQNKDKRCFMWSILAALHPTKKNPQRLSKYRQFETELDFTGISFPVSMADIPKFETQNGISVNVLGYEKGALFPVHITKQRFERHVDLLMITDSRKSHYCWIRNVDRLLSDQHTCKNQYYHCIYCFQGFTKQRILQEHVSYCRQHGTQRIDLPKEEDKWLFYKDFRKQMKVPYIIYADFESFQVPISGCSKDPNLSYTEKVTQHVPSSFAYKVVGLTKGICKKPVVYRGPDVATKFIEFMVKEQEEIEHKFKHVEPMTMTGSDWQAFKKSRHMPYLWQRVRKRQSA